MSETPGGRESEVARGQLTITQVLVFMLFALLSAMAAGILL